MAKRASGGAVQQSRTSSWFLLVAVWCVAACMGQEQCRFETGTGECTLALDELPTAELQQICARAGFKEAMTAIRRRQRDNPMPNRADLTVEAEKCLMMDKMRSSDPKKWTRDIVSLSYEQYAVFGQENADIRRNVFGTVFQAWATNQVAARTYLFPSPEEEQELVQDRLARRDDLYIDAVELFSLPDEEVQYQMLQIARSYTSADLANLNPDQEAFANMEIYKIVDSIQLDQWLDEIDEKYLLLMLSHVDPNALERLITEDIPDLKSMQPCMTVDWIAASILGAIALGSAFLLKRSGIFSRNGREKDEEGQRVRGGGKKKSRRKRMRGAETSGALLVAVWCVVVAACMGQEQCRFETGTGDCTLPLNELSTAELQQICARTGFEEAMTAIRRRQRNDPTPNRADLTVEAEKCLMLDKMRSSDPKKWTRDIVSLSYEQYAVFGQENNDIRRNVFVGIFQTWALFQIARTHRLYSSQEEQEVLTKLDVMYMHSVEAFSTPDEEIQDTGSPISEPESMNPAQEAWFNRDLPDFGLD